MGMIVQFNDIMRSFNALAGSAPKPVTGCLVDVENGSRLEFCFNPGEIDDDIPVNYAFINIPGQGHSVAQWSSNSSRKLAYSLDFYRKNSDDNYVRRKIQWLERVKTPTYDAEGYLSAAPHRVLFLFGNLFNGSKKWLITQAKVRYNNLWTKSLDPLWATVDIELTEWHDDNNFGRRS